MQSIFRTYLRLANKVLIVSHNDSALCSVFSNFAPKDYRQAVSHIMVTAPIFGGWFGLFRIESAITTVGTAVMII